MLYMKFDHVKFCGNQKVELLQFKCVAIAR